MDFTKYVTVLQNSSLYFAQLRIMEDKHEGTLTANDRKIIQGTVDREENTTDEVRANRKNHQVDLFTSGRNTIYISCWHMNRHESAAMWKLYMKSDEGIAIRTTLGDMRKAFKLTPETVHPFAVKYIDYSKDTIIEDGITVFGPAVRKRKSFEHEAEMRLAWWCSGETEQGDTPIAVGPPFLDHGPGRNIKVILSDLVQQVYVSPTSPIWIKDMVENVTRKYELDCPVVKSDLNSDPVF